MTTSHFPEWWNSLLEQHQKRIGRVFILNDNVNDLVYYPQPEGGKSDNYYKSPHPFRDMLVHLLSEEGGFGPILYYSPTSPLSLHYLNSNRVHMHTCVDPKKLGGELEKLRQPQVSSDDTDENSFWQSFAKKVTAKQRTIQDKMEVLFNVEPFLERILSEYKLVLILDFFEKIANERDDETDFRTEEMIRRWALSDRIKKSSNLVIGMTVDYKSLPQLLRTSDSRIQGLKVSVPGVNERNAFLQYWQNPVIIEQSLQLEITGPNEGGFAPEERSIETGDVQKERIATLSTLTKGFRLLNLDTMCRMAHTPEYQGKVTGKLLKSQKATLIGDESAGLLEEIPAKHSFEDIGGLEYAKTYFHKVAENIAGGTVNSGNNVPKGILLAGPPGTGKTILAEALAGEAGVSLVKMGDVRGSYIGQSEQNMTRTLKFLLALSPVIVFVDEIDQTLGARSTGRDGDSGVGQRLFGKILEFMGDNNNRGKVLWVAASNRPDLLDEAMLSRFDTVMAILPPYAVEECEHILKTMEKRITEVCFSDDFKNNIYKVAIKLAGMSGRSLETIIRKAAVLANDESDGDKDTAGRPMLKNSHVDKAIELYKPNSDIRELDSETIRALMAVNFTDMVPDDYDLYPERLRPYVKRAFSGEKKSNLPLRECLEKINGGFIYRENHVAD